MYIANKNEIKGLNGILMIPFFIAMNVLVKIILGVLIFFGTLVLKNVAENSIHTKWLLLSIELLLYAGLLIATKQLARKYTLSENKIFEVRLIRKDVVVFFIVAALFSIVYFTATILFDAKDLSQWKKILSFSVIANVLLVAFFEELLFRYYLFAAMLGSKVNIYLTILISSILFSVVHANQYGVLTLIAIVMMAFVLSLLFLITKSLAAPIALHFVNNLFAEYYKLFGPIANSKEGALSDICIFSILAIILGIYAYHKKSFQNPMQLFNR